MRIVGIVTPLDFSPVRTERLRLRLLTEHDVDAVHRYQSDPDVVRYLPYGPRDHDTVAERIAEWSQHRRVADEGDYLQLAVERREDGLVLGDLYFTLRSTQHETVFIGWVFAPDQGGRGYATEAARALLTLAFDGMGAHRVGAELDARNDRSAALCRRLGMREEAWFRSDFRYKDQWADTRMFGMLATEWAAQPA